MAVQDCEQSEQSQACGKGKMPDMVLDHSHEKSPVRADNQRILAKAAAGRTCRR